MKGKPDRGACGASVRWWAPVPAPENKKNQNKKTGGGGGGQTEQPNCWANSATHTFDGPDRGGT